MGTNDWFPNCTDPDGMCVDCNKVNTTSQCDGEFVCASCSNKRYHNELREGDRVEIKLRLKDFKPGTLTKIRNILSENKLGLGELQD